MKKAIVCDDSRTATFAIQKMLKEAGIEILSSALAVEEFGALLETVDKPDFVTMDMVLPDGDGVQACKKLWKKWARLPVIMITANEVPTEKKVQLPHVINYIVKPITRKKLNSAIAEI